MTEHLELGLGAVSALEDGWARLCCSRCHMMWLFNSSADISLSLLCHDLIGPGKQAGTAFDVEP